mgnify:CR=1 FL=1|tara:strand:- start:49303 stop:50034 length:732 start_codon:yes stop_codon:yes gene_type:complete
MPDGRLQRLIGFQDEVRLAFEWDYSDDLDSAKSMESIFSQASPYGIESWSEKSRNLCLQKICEELQHCERVVIIGAAVEKQEIAELNLENTAVIAADGSVGAMIDYEFLTCVISDLDGGQHIDLAAEKSQRFVLHAHGDNLTKWQNIVENWSQLKTPPEIILSHQTNENMNGMYNFGGFTDGDRAVCFALWAGVKVKQIELIGFSTKKVGAWSGTTNQDRKMKKLSWMKKILTFLNLEKNIKH